MNIENKLWFGIIVGAVVLLIVSVILYATFKEENVEEGKTSIPVILEGYEIEYKYTVRIGGPNGPVYDSNMDNIINSSLVEKTVFYNNYAQWPERFIVGEHPADAELPSFSDHFIGHEEGDHFNFVLSGVSRLEYNDSKRVEIPVKEKIPLYETVNKEQFKSSLGAVDLKVGMIYNHGFWGWEIEIFEFIDENNMTIYHRPEIGYEIDVLPWSSEVKDVSSETGFITLNHDLTDKDLLKGQFYPFEYTDYSDHFDNMNNPGYIQQLGPNYIVIEFNDERAGADIYFDIEIVRILNS